MGCASSASHGKDKGGMGVEDQVKPIEEVNQVSEVVSIMDNANWMQDGKEGNSNSETKYLDDSGKQTKKRRTGSKVGNENEKPPVAIDTEGRADGAWGQVNSVNKFLSQAAAAEEDPTTLEVSKRRCSDDTAIVSSARTKDKTLKRANSGGRLNNNKPLKKTSSFDRIHTRSEFASLTKLKSLPVLSNPAEKKSKKRSSTEMRDKVSRLDINSVMRDQTPTGKNANRDGFTMGDRGLPGGVSPRVRRSSASENFSNISPSNGKLPPLKAKSTHKPRLPPLGAPNPPPARRRSKY